MMGDSAYWIEFCLMVFSSIVKFVITPSIMVARGWSFVETVLISTIGAVIGCSFFYHSGDLFFKWLQGKRRRQSKKFSWKSRALVRVKSKLGLMGLLLISGLISVPITAVLAARYFKKKSTLPLLFLAFFLWSIILTGISMGFGNLIQFLSR
ncbi:MAG: hypothetical protein ACI9HG_000782 [Flavobacteriales bacterium]